MSNWRRRNDDFPEPVGGTDRNPRFALAEIESWLTRVGKASEISADERLWQAFDSVRSVLPPVDALAASGVLLSYLRARCDGLAKWTFLQVWHRSPRMHSPHDRFLRRQQA